MIWVPVLVIWCRFGWFGVDLVDLGDLGVDFCDLASMLLIWRRCLLIWVAILVIWAAVSMIWVAIVVIWKQRNQPEIKEINENQRNQPESKKSACRPRVEILKFNLIPNERLESSCGTLWLGIRMFFGSNGWIFIDF